jgi:alpha-L-rhamnosidase
MKAVFFTLLASAIFSSLIHAAPVRLVDEPPVKITTVARGVVLVDFGRVAFGNLRFLSPPKSDTPVTIHFGEAFEKGRINRKPPGSVRYASIQMKLDGKSPLVAAPPADERNTSKGKGGAPPAILTPSEWGVVLPFRWVEIEGWPGELSPAQIQRQSAYAATWDDGAASFECSDGLLNRIWELCRYSIKATTFAGVYVDGDRERIPYEADAYLNQISHYTTDNDVQMARDTIDHLMKHPTWPSEWAPHMVLMAHADWMRTGDAQWLAPRYESFKKKMLLERARPDGLIASNEQQIKRTDIIDWPMAERDQYVFTPANTVVNAFHLRALKCMAEMATGLGHTADATNFTEREKSTRSVFQKTFFDPKSGLYRDGIDTNHSSQHANFFPLAFGLVPETDRAGVAKWLAKRGMKCSVYAAQYLLEGLFENGESAQAIALITAPTDRSWKHMVESGTTITWEAWDQKYKSNQDWNHAWGAAPANLLPRFVIGAQPLTPGWKRAKIRPHPAGLSHAKGKIPSPLGPVFVAWKDPKDFEIYIKLPAGMTAKVELPAKGNSSKVLVNGKAVKAQRNGDWWILDQDVSGTSTIQVL